MIRCKIRKHTKAVAVLILCVAVCIILIAAFGKKDIPQTKLEYMFTFLESGASSILKKWVRGGMAESEEYIADLISEIFISMHSHI